MSFTMGTLVGFKIADGSIIYGNIGKPAPPGRLWVIKEDRKSALPPLSSLFIPDKVKCQCGSSECKNTGLYSRDDMAEGLTGWGEMWFHPVCVDYDQGDFNYCQDCNVLCFCDECETLVFESTGIMDFCPKCWEDVSEEDKIEGKKLLE